MSETKWTLTICNKLRDELSQYNLYVDVEVKLPYQLEIKRYDANWNYQILEEAGFKIDLLIYEKQGEYNIPRVAIESKFNEINTHSVMVYSKKAEQHKNIMPFLRYGIMIGAMENLPRRVLKHGDHFDFICCFESEKPTDKEWYRFVSMVVAEVEISKKLEKLIYEKEKCCFIQKKFID